MHLPPRRQWFRVWIAVYERWQPRSWVDVPPNSVVLEPADDGCLSADEAAVYIEAFNQAMIAHPRNRWAVAVPVTIRYEGDLMPGQKVGATATWLPSNAPIEP